MVPWWYPPIGRPIGSPPLDTRITWPWPPGPAVSYQSFGAASVLGGNTPRALEGQGRTAIRGRPIGGPSAHGQTVGHAPNARHRSHRLLISDCNGRDPCSGAAPPVTAFRPCPGAAPPGSGRFSRRDAEVRAALCWRRLRRPSRYRPPGFWAVLQENGLEFDALPGFWAVISVPRRDSRRCLRYNPRSEAFTSSAPRSAAYETAQNFARALANAQVPLHAAGLRNRPELCLAFQATNQSVGQAVRETAQNSARALPEHV